MRDKKSDLMYHGVCENTIRGARPALCNKAVKMLHEYIIERYTIHKKKDVLRMPAPWTDNEILNTYRFTNIRREHDLETRWLIKKIAHNRSLTLQDKILNIILFRLYNKHQTMVLIGAPFRFKADGFCAEDHRSALKSAPEGFVYFTGAFNTGGVKRFSGELTGEPYIPMRILKLIEIMIERGVAERIINAGTPTEIMEILNEFKGIGKFLGYQMFVDFSYIQAFKFSENEFTQAGPGCRAGLNILFDSPDGMTPEECLFWLRDNISEVFRELELYWNPEELFDDLPDYDRSLNVMSLENIFCEFSKYWRAATGNGRPRKKYQPSSVEV